MSAEARRQQALLAAIAGAEAVGLRERGARAARGLVAYRANARATAERALAAVFPDVQAMVGADTFRAMAAGHWHDAPPACGDLGEWGGGFPGWIEAQPSLADWPWLADSARLELALHRCERAADAVLDAASLHRLGEADPATLRLVPMPGTALVASRFPIVAIHRAHRTAAGFEAARAALEAGRGETALVVRRGWRAEAQALDAGRAAWMRALLDGASVAAGLQAAGPGFDLAAWLADALREGWLKGSEPMPDPAG